LPFFCLFTKITSNFHFMEQKKLQLLPPDVGRELDSLFDAQKEGVADDLSELQPGQQPAYIEMLRCEMTMIRRKIKGEFPPDGIRKVFDIIINYRSRGQIKSRYDLIKFLVHIREEKAGDGDLTPEQVIAFLNSKGEGYRFEGAGERLLYKVRYSCEADISSRANK
jgi:hypothetical protein